MRLKRWKSQQKANHIRLKKKTQKDGGDYMENIINLKKYSKENKIKNYSIFDMILDPIKRKEAKKYFDNNYEETQEEKEIFEAWKKRRTRRND